MEKTELVFTKLAQSPSKYSELKTSMHIKQQLEQIRADQNFPPDLSIPQWMQRIQSEDLPFQNTLVNRPTIVQGSPSDEVRLVIGIKTAVLKYFAQRQAIRETWANTTGIPTHVNVSFLDVRQSWTAFQTTLNASRFWRL
ncbi:hypothetical protein F444_13959 [Phytophthora nicotianae P1976]|uniref:Hexosyltransferase n=1 Tax=Phytophthora nicotianae P1976 TaxID=1317066 RepID=A0A080ZS36_PHYNI|nr:hypothetical protein F444_13959 [Phytophthora nicotianae P1976]